MAQDDDIQVMVCPTGPGDPRNSEAAIVVLRDGTLLLAYSRFYGGGDPMPLSGGAFFRSFAPAAGDVCEVRREMNAP